ncbi:hypothetical protein BGW36DRAFT_396293 [Talaromyces proteolyticus]|uniref:Cell wall proline rich protein n=1 Tax=Talaromyces proteolyticus TaxID=1131652 RepID=A0AAD4PWT9_9EURO|nr:uncharacterized protein BGW36DRAFT_396293 [Talaromyces proteolyticus]KAH8698532.1 hypothetical protein BGW36DRAFT_396293 [Talaromyces proteolyticus]
MDFHPDDSHESVSHIRPPNPPFVFPRRPSDASSDYMPPPLPTFSFNPGNLHAPTPSTSAITVPRPGGHRRRPSELIGGDGPPSPRMLSSSPGKQDLDITGVPLPAPGPPAHGPSRRGHAHRRSQAMSSMDLTAMTKAVPPTLTVGSAPTTPADAKHEFQDKIIQPMSRSAISLLHHPTPPDSPAGQPIENTHPDFGNTLHPEPRPRPVSMISNETSSSLSTVRPGHSRANSVNPPGPKVESSSQPPKIRPKTADAASLMVLRPTDHIPLPDLPLFRRSSVGNRLTEPFRLSSEADEAPQKKRSKKQAKKKKPSEQYSKHESTNKMSLEGAVDMARDLSSDKWESASSTRSGGEDCGRKVRKTAKRDKKVRSWAGAIFPLKSRRHHVKKVSRRTPTPPPILTRTNSVQGSIEVDFDTDNTVIIRTPTNPNAPTSTIKEPPPPADVAFESSWKPRSFYEQNIDNDVFSPVIDLDAALGPFNTPEMSSGRVAGSAFSQATKRMYSGGRRGEFVGPEMRYHRRAESAPEMPPIDRSSLGFPRLGSNSTMAHADVFYEEEEDAFLAENHLASDESNSVSDDDSISSVIESEVEPSSSDTLRGIQENTIPPADDGLGIHVAQHTMAEENVEDGPGDAIDSDECIGTSSYHREMTSQKSVEIFEPEQWAAPRVPYATSPDVSPHMLPMEKRPYSSPLDFSSSLPQLSLPSRQPSSSAFPSPDPSNMSFDGPHSATASSMTDQTTFNHPFQDQMQYSAEDIPSLTSSASTKTNSRGRFSANFYTRTSGERPVSFSSQLPPRTSNSTSAKRASLVSLSRLMSGTYGEKSKLCHEEKPPADEAENSRKKNHRMSRRLMFWKSKDKQKAGD